MSGALDGRAHVMRASADDPGGGWSALARREEPGARVSAAAAADEVGLGLAAAPLALHADARAPPAEGPTLSFTATNTYTKTAPVLEYPWAKLIVEPHRVTSLEASSGGHVWKDACGSKNEGCEWRWALQHASMPRPMAGLSGQTIDHTFVLLGW